MPEGILHITVDEIGQVFFQFKFLTPVKQGVANVSFDGFSIYQYIIFFPIRSKKTITIVGSLPEGEGQFGCYVVIGGVIEGIFRCDLTAVCQIGFFLSIMFYGKFLQVKGQLLVLHNNGRLCPCDHGARGGYPPKIGLGGIGKSRYGAQK